MRSDGEEREGRGTRGGRAAEGDSEDGEGARRRNGSGREEKMRAFLAQSVAHRLEGVNKAVIAGCDAARLLGRRLAACLQNHSETHASGFELMCH